MKKIISTLILVLILSTPVLADCKKDKYKKMEKKGCFYSNDIYSVGAVIKKNGKYKCTYNSPKSKDAFKENGPLFEWVKVGVVD